MTKRDKEIMEKLGLTEKEYLELKDYDEKVDKNLPTEYDLTNEQKKVVKEMTKATSKATKTKVVRERKPNEEKAEIIKELAEKLKEFDENVTILNKEREISFKIGENDYSITLICHRKPKK